MRVLLFRVPAADPGRDAGDAERLAALSVTLGSLGVETSLEKGRDPGSLRDGIRRARPDLAYSPSGPFTGHQGAWVQDVFEEAELPYVGSSTVILARCLSKPALKERWREVGVNTPDWLLLRPGAPPFMDAPLDVRLFPAIAKPASGGNSLGITEASVFDSPGRLRECLPSLFAEQGECILERYLGMATDRREFTVALIGGAHDGLLLPAEIILPGERNRPLVRAGDKDGQGTIVRPLEPGAFRERVIAFARPALEAAGPRDYARMDLIHAEGELHAIEINGQPMIPDPWFRQCAAGAGLEDSYVALIFTVAVERARREGRDLPALPRPLLRLVPEDLLHRPETMSAQEAAP